MHLLRTASSVCTWSEHFGINGFLEFQLLWRLWGTKSWRQLWAARVVHVLSDCLLISLKWLKGQDTWLWGFLFNLLVNVMCEINLAADWSSLLGVRRDMLGTCRSRLLESEHRGKHKLLFFFFCQSILFANSPTAEKLHGAVHQWLAGWAFCGISGFSLLWGSQESQLT